MDAFCVEFGFQSSRGLGTSWETAAMVFNERRRQKAEERLWRR